MITRAMEARTRGCSRRLLDDDATEGADIADARQAALALVTGLAANRSFETGLPVRTADLLKL